MRRHNRHRWRYTSLFIWLFFFFVLLASTWTLCFNLADWIRGDKEKREKETVNLLVEYKSTNLCLFELRSELLRTPSQSRHHLHLHSHTVLSAASCFQLSSLTEENTWFRCWRAARQELLLRRRWPYRNHILYHFTQDVVLNGTFQWCRNHFDKLQNKKHF